MATFSSLGVSEFLIRSLKAMSISAPTPVQQACIPPILAGRDCIGSAQTGSGKTIAFALPILQSLSNDPYGIYALVLTPTRELAFQIHQQFTALGTAINLESVVITGGMDMMHQSIALKKRPHVIVATPGRLVDLLKSSVGEWDLSRLKYLVLDEADRMLAPTFAEELGYIIQNIPTERQTLLFTATVTEPIMALEKKEPKPGKQKPFLHLSEAVIHTPQTLIQKYIFIPSQVRETYVFHLFANLTELTGAQPLPSRKPIEEPPKRRQAPKKEEDSDLPPPIPQTILFVSRCRTAAVLSLIFEELGIPNAPLHSHLTQKERFASLARFRASSVALLIATDVGSRGLDIPTVEVVVNWDVPRDPDDYIHRVGRTARAGRAGTAITVVTEGDVELVGLVEERVGSKMEELTLDEEKVLESLNKVMTAKRVANMQLHSDKFGEAQERRKKIARKKAKASSKTSTKLGVTPL